MKKSVVTGHRSRSRGVFYTIANETMNYTDTLTQIDMSDTAEVPSGLENQPFSWDLHNHVMNLAEESKRPCGQGYYLPALEKAHELLKSMTMVVVLSFSYSRVMSGHLISGAALCSNQ